MCGGVRYELTAPPEYAGYCHCTRCQRRTGGSAAISARTVHGSYRVTSGETVPRRSDRTALRASSGRAAAENLDGEDPLLAPVRV